LASVREFMSKTPVTIDCKRTVADAWKLMGEEHIGSILVSREGVTHGIFTERDLLSKALSEKKDLNSIPVGDYASSPLITVPPGADVKEAARIMTEMKVRRLVVVQDGKPVGLFTAADLARAVGKFPLEL